MHSDIAGIGVLSLSKDPLNVLMWAHYAANHEGFCAGFDFPENFTVASMETGMIGKHDAIYNEGNPVTDYLMDFAERSFAMTDSERRESWNSEFWINLMGISMVSKAKPWEYEDEVRFLRREPGPVSFAPESLTEIIFGVAMSDERRETIRKILSAPEWRHIRFKEMVRTAELKLEQRDCT